MADRAGATARGRRRLGRSEHADQLHVAYGNALIAARGYGAPETTEAFTRARESALRDKDAPRTIGGRLRLMGRQLRARRVAVDADYAAAFLSDVAARTRFSPRPASRIALLGITHWFAGEYPRLGIILERALGLVPTRPRRRSRLSLRTGPRRRDNALIWRSHYGRWARSNARFPSLSDAQDAAWRSSPMSARSHVRKIARGPVRTDARRHCARDAKHL